MKRQAQHLSRSRSGGGIGADPVAVVVNVFAPPDTPTRRLNRGAKPAPAHRRNCPDVHPPAPPLVKFLAGPFASGGLRTVGTLTLYGA